ncbi:ABC transporter ATP-binding protein/permease [Streptococcus catagoni]|uniref:ABC transporter ATP-binding protein/permease n=1 Tax=Streptococcus catagoni TaxID=2654874 RepID=UPI00140DF668|nr:ABC transporter ATP-binding protein/permease [Streptococcus catagoni]
MIENKKTMSRQEKETLLKRLKERIAPKMGLIYLAAFLAWLQFLMRVISFYLIAQSCYRLYQGKTVHLLYLGLALLGLNFCGFLLALFAKKLQGVASQYARDSLKKSFFDAFIARDGHFEENTTLADTFTVASQGIDSLDTYYSHYLSLSLRTLLNCSSVLLILCFIFPKGVLLFLLSLPFIPISILAMQKRSKAIMNHYWHSYMDVGNLFLDDLKGLNTLYSYQVDQDYEEEFLRKAEDFRLATMRLLSFQLQAVAYMDSIMYLGIGLSGLLAVHALIAGQLSLASFIFFILIATEFFAPIREQGYGMHLVMMNTKMADRIFSFLDSISLEPEREDLLGAQLSAFDSLSLVDLSFSYDQNPLLEDINLTLKKGQITALAAVSGLGKTSLAQLFLKRLTPLSGAIYFGDKEIAELSQKAINQEVMYVSDQSYILDKSIYDNLAMATDMSKAQLMDWLERTNSLAFIKDLPDGLDSLVGENGQNLSPGQRQQLVCLRALLAKRSFYIFDEITASVDSENEALILDLIGKVAKEAIVLMITHKMKQVALADQVLFLEAKGKSQLASPASLYATNEVYRHLVDTQARLEANYYG